MYKYLVIFLLFLFLFPLCVIGQYYEFTWNSSSELWLNIWFQQWCNEEYAVYFNTEWEVGITVWQPFVVLDDTKIDYTTWLDSDLFYLEISDVLWFLLGFDDTLNGFLNIQRYF